MNSPRIFISACEASADALGEEVARALLRALPQCQLDGTGGPLMRHVMQPTFAMEGMAVMGFGGVLRKSAYLLRQFWQMRQHLLQARPHLVVTIDYSGMHLRLMRNLKRSGLNAQWLHVIAPSTWLGGKWHRKILEDFADHLAVIFPAECSQHGDRLPCSYIGNTIAREIAKEIATPPSPSFNASKPLIGIFPGSRLGEIERNLPLLLRVGGQLRERIGGTMRVSCCQSPGKGARIAERIAQLTGPIATIAHPPANRALLRESHIAIAVSGTVCLELALCQTPFVAVYKLGGFDYLIAKYLLRVQKKLPHFSLPNLLLGETNFPEFFGYRLPEDQIAESALKLMPPGPDRSRCQGAGWRLAKLFADSPSREIGDIAQELLR